MTDPLNPLLLSGIPVHDNAAWRSPWDTVVANPAVASYVELSDGRVLGVCNTAYATSPSQMIFAHASSVSAFISGSATMTIDRVVVSAAGGSSAAQRNMTNGICRDPDDPTKLLLTWTKVADNATWTYGTGFPAPSTTASRTFIYQSSDEGATWTEIAVLDYSSGGSSTGNQYANGPVQKFGSTYLLCAVTRQQHRHIWSSTDKVNWTRRFGNASGAAQGSTIGYLGGVFYNWGSAGLARSTNGTSWSNYNTSLTAQGGPWFTFSLDGGATVKHGVVRRPGTGISSILVWASTSTVTDPVPADWSTDETYDSTGYSLPAANQPTLNVLGSSHAVIVTGPRILAAELAPDVDTYPALSVEVAYVNDPTDTSWTWEDITPWVKKITTRVGRDRELDDFEPGRATLVLDNADRRFDPEHATGPYYGDLLPSKRVRIRATHKTVTYTLFHGFVDDWPQDYSGAWESEVVVPCTDAFGQIARVDLASSVYAAEVLSDSPHAWWRCTEQDGNVWYDSSGNGRHATSADTIQPRPSPLPLIPNDDRADSVKIPQSFEVSQTIMPPAPFTIEAWIDTPRVSGAADAVAAGLLYWYTDQDTFTLGGIRIGSASTAARFKRVQVVGDLFDESVNYVRTTSNTVNDSAVHHIVVRVSAANVWSVYVDGVFIFTTTSGTLLAPNNLKAFLLAGTSATQMIDGVQVPLDAGWRAADIAMYASELGGSRVTAHYQTAMTSWSGDLVGARINRIYSAAGWPSGLRSTATGLTRLGPAHLNSQNALAYLRSTANAEQGQLFCDMANEGKVTFLDRHERLTAARSTTPQYVFSDEDDPDSVHYERIDLKRDGRDVINSVTVKWTGGEATSTDAASIATYGLKSHTVTTELGSRIEAENMGEWIIGRYGRPVARCRSLELNPAAYFPAFTAALDTRINDRATIRKLPGSVGDPIELDAIVEGIEHHIDAGVNVWTTRLRLSQADAGPWWIPDVGVPDISTRPAW